MDHSENEAGLYAEYTYSIRDKFSLVAGARGDYNSFYDKYYFTPRGHIKWNITRLLTLRASAGLGYRSTNLVTDNIGVLATGRRFAFDGYAWNGDYDFHTLYRDFNRMEKALTVGGSLTQTFGLVKPEDATLSFDYFRTQFYNQVVADQEYSATEVMFYNTDGRSYTDTYQVDFNWTPVERLDIFATYRYTDSSMTLDRPDGGRAGRTAAGEPLQGAAEYPVRHAVPPLDVRRHGSAQRPHAPAFADGRPDRDGALAQVPGLLRAGEPQDQETRPLPRLREHRQLQAGAPDPRCRSSLLHRLQLIGGVGPADGTQVLYRPAVELVLRVFYSADIEPCRQSLQTSL